MLSDKRTDLWMYPIWNMGYYRRVVKPLEKKYVNSPIISLWLVLHVKSELIKNLNSLQCGKSLRMHYLQCAHVPFNPPEERDQFLEKWSAVAPPISVSWCSWKSCDAQWERNCIINLCRCEQSYPRGLDTYSPHLLKLRGHWQTQIINDS